MAATRPQEDDSPRTANGDREGRGFAATGTGSPAKQLECSAVPAPGRARVAVAGGWSLCDPERDVGPPYARNTRNPRRDAVDRLGAGLHRPVACDRLPDREEKGELNRHENGKWCQWS